MPETLSIVLGPHGQVRDLRSGAVGVPGYTLRFTEVKRMPDAYRDMARTQPYEVCEMAPTAYLMALSAGAPLTALALPMTRRFRHAGVQRLADGALRGPKDLEGQAVGVRNYAVTAAVWTRGIYADDYGLELDRVTWLTEEEDNLPQFPLPPNARRIAPGLSLGAMLEQGTLQAAFAGLAGAGNAVQRPLVELVSDAAEREAQWYARTGIYPLHGVIVVRNDVLQRDPGVAAQLFEAFVQAKANYLAHLQRGVELDAEDKRYLALQKTVGDPLPYGLAENASSFEALVRYVRQQHLTAAQPPIASLFIDPRTSVPGQLARWEA